MTNEEEAIRFMCTIRVATIWLVFFVVSCPAAAEAAPTLKGRAVWASPRDAGTTEASVIAFARMAFEEGRKVRPAIEFSAAVFKNPVHSGRFIGQDWRRFSPWVQYLMPMDYRSHYPGDFETHLDLLAESVCMQKEWAAGFKHLWIGIASGFLYNEEREPLQRIRDLLRSGGQPAAIQKAFDPIAESLRKYSPDLHGSISGFLQNPGSPQPVARDIDAFFAKVPPGFYPGEKLTRTLERVKAQGVEGIVIFSASGISSAGLWDAVEEFFGK